MKKVLFMLAMLAIPFAMQAQKYHDVEFNEAKGPVKSIKSSVMGQMQVTNFTPDGKMTREGMTDVVYDANGYVQSAKMEMQGQQMAISYKWQDGHVVSQKMNMMGNDVEIKRTYNAQGAPAADSFDMGGQTMEMPYTDYKYDDHGNWISRKTSMMGQEMEEQRKIEYYE